MTREEAISCIKQIKFRGYLRGANPFYEQDTEALNMAIQALSQEPADTWSIKDVADTFKKHGLIREQQPCDEKKDCSTCKYEEYSSNYQPCRDCGTLLESYTNWEQKERELPCIYDLKNRNCPRLNEHGMLKYPLQEQTTPMSTFDIAKQFGIKLEPCEDDVSRQDVISREAVLDAVSEGCQEWRGIYGRCEELINELPSVTQKSGKWLLNKEKSHFFDVYECSNCGKISGLTNYCPNCGAKMESEDKDANSN